MTVYQAAQCASRASSNRYGGALHATLLGRNLLLGDRHQRGSDIEHLKLSSRVAAGAGVVVTVVPLFGDMADLLPFNLIVHVMTTR